MTKKQILLTTIICLATLILVSISTVFALNVIRGKRPSSNTNQTSTSQQSTQDTQKKQAEDYRQEAVAKQGEGKHDEAIELLEKAKAIYTELKDSEKLSQTELDIVIFKDIKKNAPPVVTNVSKASGGE